MPGRPYSKQRERCALQLNHKPRMRELTMNEVQDLLEDLNACANSALELLATGDLDGCRTALKALIDGIGEQLEGEEED